MNIYKGRDLKIAVIGAIPEVREENITFEKITLEDLQHNTDNLSNEVDAIDAIMIMKEFLHEADDDQYVAAYRSLKIPTFFMQSTKVHVPLSMKVFSMMILSKLILLISQQDFSI